MEFVLCSLFLFIIAYRNKSRSVLVLDRVGVVRVLWSIGLMNVNIYAIRRQKKQNSGIQFIQMTVGVHINSSSR
jgi:hypothetical protein